MNCIERTELEQFLKGRLAPERMLAVDEHVGQCAQCKSKLMGLPGRADFGMAVVGTTDCPEYEELSAYVDDSLDAKQAITVRAHANACELCTKDIERIRELRSHAALRQKITVKPGMSRLKQRNVLVYWKQVLAGVSLAGAAAIALMISQGGAPVAKNPAHVATNPPAVHQPIAATDTTEAPEMAANPTQAPTVTHDAARPKVEVAVNPRPTSSVKSVLRDGSYSVIRNGERLAFAAKDGGSVRTKLEARIAASIDEKIRTGKIKPAKSVQVAMASPLMRGENGYEVPPTAPKQIGPIGKKIVMSDRPTFTWTAVDLADSYRVRIYNASHNLVVDQIVKKNSFTPAKPLARGQVYSWRVGTGFGETDQWAESAAAGFAVLSSEDLASIKRVQSNIPGSHLALGAAYESVGLNEEALNEYRALRRANPGSKLAQKMIYGAAQH